MDETPGVVIENVGFSTCRRQRLNQDWSTWASGFSAMVQLTMWPVGLTWNEHAQIIATYDFQKHFLHTLRN